MTSPLERAEQAVAEAEADLMPYLCRSLTTEGANRMVDDLIAAVRRREAAVTARRPMSARRAQAVIDGATLVKAPTWREDRHWHVAAADGTVLVVVTPSYGGTSRSGRNGWRYWLADAGPSGSRDREPTRQAAAAAGLAAWRRRATHKP